jgi:hypothetical protein
LKVLSWTSTSAVVSKDKKHGLDAEEQTFSREKLLKITNPSLQRM